MLPTTRCSGCTACAAVCPVNCIEMKPDRDGFLYPHICASKCIHCGKCEKTCPVLNMKPTDDLLPKAYAARNMDENCRKSSSSGGVFSILAEWVLAQGGIVYGAALNENMQVVHRGAENSEQLAVLRGSKYIASELGNIFSQVKQQLINMRVVLFSGTPCQIEGLLAFLGRPYDNLYTIDLICHGVPTKKAWNRYCEYQQKQHGAKIVGANFRSKCTGWKKFSLMLHFENGKTYASSQREDLYLRAFLDNLCLRPSCHDCVFKSKHRHSDITLADFWGIETMLPDEDDDGGVSLVLVHSKHGGELLAQCHNSVWLMPVNPSDAISRNSAMTASVSPHPFRDYFLHQLEKTPFNKLVSDCFAPPYSVRLHRQALKVINRIKQRKE